MFLLVCKLSEMYVLNQDGCLHLWCNGGRHSVFGHPVSYNVQLLGDHLYRAFEIVRLSAHEGKISKKELGRL